MNHGGLPYAKLCECWDQQQHLCGTESKAGQITIAFQNSTTSLSHQVGVRSLQQHACQRDTINSSGTRH